MKSFIANDVFSDIYIGNSAGKRMFNKIQKAKKVVRIISPYLDSNTIDHLVALDDKGIKVKLISTDQVKDYSTGNRLAPLSKIIRQKRIVLNDKKEARNKFFTLVLTLFGFFVTYLILSGILFSLDVINLFTNTWYIMILWAIIIVTMYSKYKNWVIYKYSYFSIFEGFFVISPYNMSEEQRRTFNNRFLHSKLFIIDDKVAFLGSLNFTMAGIYRNFETCVTIKNKDTIAGLIDYYEKLLNENYFIVDIDYYGKLIFPEPKN